MPPQFTTHTVWQQADLLMQPALIRLLDNLRKESERLDWTATYDNQLHWPEGTTEAQKLDYDRLHQLLYQADGDTAPSLEVQLAQLPQPRPHYGLCLSQADRQATFDIWTLCYQICFDDYVEDQPVSIDSRLLNGDEVDWDQLEQKTKAIVLGIFANLSQ